MGDTVTFIRYEILGWMDTDADRMRGNYSAHVVRRSAHPDDCGAQIGRGKSRIDWR